MKHILVIPCMLVLISTYSCRVKDPQQRIAARYDTFETECLGVELDGSQTLKAWGTGRNRWDAIEQAYKNAVRDVLFKGIRDGRSDCNVRPIIMEVNAEQKYQDFFFKFFADKGPYTQFVSKKDGGTGNAEVRKTRKQASIHEDAFGITVRVLRSELAAHMRAEGIIK